jgi:hypothetical protein
VLANVGRCATRLVEEVTDGIFAVNSRGVFLLLEPGFTCAQANASKVFLLEDTGNSQWCSYNAESTWKVRVQAVGAMTVGTLTYRNDHLAEIDVTETDETGDWMVYDHYFLDDHGQLVRLSRLLNVLPGDRSVSRTYSISGGKATMTTTAEKQLSTGKRVTSSTSDWLPDIPIETTTKTFPFSALLSLPDLRTSSKSCVKVPALQ